MVYSQIQILFKTEYSLYGHTLDSGANAIMIQLELQMPLLSGKMRMLVHGHHGARVARVVSILINGFALKALHASRSNLRNVQCCSPRTKFSLSTLDIVAFHSQFSGPSGYPQFSRNLKDYG